MEEARFVYSVNPSDAARHTENMTMGGTPIPPPPSWGLLSLDGFLLALELVPVSVDAILTKIAYFRCYCCGCC